jgi:sulfate adenylyltransferase subunit 1 (EFTu-like GTPase family)
MRPVRVAVAGSVDDGKSTLLGRLMCDAERVFRDELEAVQRASSAELNLAFFTDGLMLERREGITLDVAWRHLQLGKQRLLLADVPGHAELVRNMATGASTADAALLLVDAERGVQLQTRRHLVMLSGLGVKQVIICINKMDAVAFSGDVAVILETELRALAEALGVTLEVIAVSALEGDNIVRRSTRMPWYSGPTVAERLALIQPRPASAHARAVVQLGSDAAGWASLHGVLPDEELTAWPSGISCRVLERSPHGVGRVRLSASLARGDLLTPAAQPARVVNSFSAIVTWLGPKAAAKGLALKVLQQGRTTHARIVELPERISLQSGAFERADSLAAGEVGRMRLELETPVWMDRWEESPVTGSCLLVDSDGQTVAGARFL